MSASRPAPHADSQGIAFTAPDVATAVEQVRTTLGPDAILLNIRRTPARGWSRLWAKPRIEVVACAPGAEAANATATPAPARPPSVAPAEAVQRYARSGALPTAASAVDEPPIPDDADPGATSPGPAAGWRLPHVLDRLGFNAVNSQRVLERAQHLHGVDRLPPATLAQELTLARAVLSEAWRPPPRPAANTAPLHLLVGPPGVGKSTVLCKWLAQTVLVEGAPAQVWRIDTRAANTAEWVSIFGEILHVRVERGWTERGESALTGFIDLPGVDYQDPAAWEPVRDVLAQVPEATVHLVLNAAYAVPLLLAQARAFDGLPVADLVLTHLDEETAWGKLWNLVLGTKYPLRLLSAGQNIPGRLLPARPELLAPPLFVEK